MPRIDLDQISRDTASGNSHSVREARYASEWDEATSRPRPSIVRVPLWLILIAVLAVVAMFAHA